MQKASIQLACFWAKVKDCIDNHGSEFHWSDLTTEYKVISSHGPFLYIVTIAKEDPRSADQADFEDNYKS